MLYSRLDSFEILNKLRIIYLCNSPKYSTANYYRNRGKCLY